jgi:selenocysteine lyase/cysteine desulfurase
VVDPLPSQRHLFHVDDEVAFLNAAYLAPRLKSVTAAGQEALERTTRPWTITAPDFFEPAEQVREAFATLVGGDADGVALLPAVSYGMSLAASNLSSERPARIVVLAEQFPSNVYPWREIGEVVTVPRPADDDWTGRVLEHIDDSVTVVALPHCHWTDGTFVDLEQIGVAAREAGAALVVDASQSLGAMSFDVRTIRPDFLVAAAYKWLLGPYSTALLWAAPHRRAGNPLEQGWATRSGSEDFTRLTAYRDELRDSARRYDVGEAGNFVLLPMLLAALRQILEWTIPRVATSLDALTSRLADELVARGMTVPSRERRAGHILGVRLPGGARDVPERLAAAGVHVSIRGEALRVGPHLHSNERDLERLVEALA